MNARTITSLVAGAALFALAPALWAAGDGGFRGRGQNFGGRGRGFGGGAPRFSAPGRNFAAAPRIRPQTLGGFHRPGIGGVMGNRPIVPNIARQQQRNFSSNAPRSRPITPSNVPGVQPRQGPSGSQPQQQATARQNGARTFTGHISERHDSNWHNDWDRRRPHFDRGRGRFFVFVNGSWGGLDAGVFPWDYYPYDAYDYYPYDYAVDGLENAPPDYAVGSVDNVPTDDHAPPQPDVTVSSVQTQLTQLGYYNGPVDGLFGPTTRDAVARYQTDQNLEVTGSLSPETLQSLKVPGKTDSN